MDSSIARRYAKALLDLAQQDGVLEGARSSLERIKKALDTSPELSEVCLNPMFNREERWRVLERVMSRLEVLPLVVQFLGLLVRKHRLIYFQEIVEKFGELVNQAYGRETVRVRIPKDMTDRDQESLKAQLEEGLGKPVALSVQTDPNLISGITVQVGSQVYDGSVRGRLNALKRVMLHDMQTQSLGSA